MSQSDNASDTPQKDLNFLTPALIGGAILGVISTIAGSLSLVSQGLGTVVSLGCCLWLLGCPILAVHLLNKQRPGGLTYGDGALAGVFTGVFGAILSTILGIPLRFLATPQLQAAADQIRNDPQMPSNVKNMILPFVEPGFNVMVLLLGLVIGLVLNSIFGAAGGSLGVAIFNRKKND
jgi:hypothetical protein